MAARPIERIQKILRYNFFCVIKDFLDIDSFVIRLHLLLDALFSLLLFDCHAYLSLNIVCYNTDSIYCIWNHSFIPSFVQNLHLNWLVLVQVIQYHPCNFDIWTDLSRYIGHYLSFCCNHNLLGQSYLVVTLGGKRL